MYECYFSKCYPRLVHNWILIVTLSNSVLLIKSWSHINLQDYYGNWSNMCWIFYECLYWWVCTFYGGFEDLNWCNSFVIVDLEVFLLLKSFRCHTRGLLLNPFLIKGWDGKCYSFFNIYIQGYRKELLNPMFLLIISLKSCSNLWALFAFPMDINK